MSYTHLTQEERYQIYVLKCQGHARSFIAKELGRSKSTLSRELRRNKGKGAWRPDQAQGKAKDRLTSRGSSNVKRASDAAWEYAKERLTNDQWSPEQIAGRLKLEGRDSISHETIYQLILKDKKAGGALFTNLRCKKKRKKRYGSARTYRDVIPNRTDIEKRPAIVDDRKRYGDWEGDTIIGSHKGGPVIASMVERKSRFTVLAKAKNKTTTEVIKSINKYMLFLAILVHTITLDNGREFSHHELMAALLNARVYFARPYHSWERGLNENTNGLVRQYFPKGIPFDEVTDADVQKIARKLNARPRKCLGYKTPFEVFGRACSQRGIPLLN